MRKLRATVSNMLRRAGPHAQRSYAQCGEDLIIRYVFGALGTTEIRYIDIGAHHPWYLSNTYLLYLNGHRGVCIEPNARLLDEFRRLRPGDTLLNIGVAPQPGLADFYVMTTPTLSTFAQAEAERVAAFGRERVERIERVQIRTVNEVIAGEFSVPPNLLSLDVEGLDLAILHSLEFDRYAPEVICVETLSYTENQTERKLSEVIEFVCEQGYFVYADTFVNTIFVRTETWQARGLQSVTA